MPSSASAVRIAAARADGAGRAVERDQETVAGSIDLPGPEAGEGGADHIVVLLEQQAPPSVTEPTREFGGAHHVGEHDREHGAVGLGDAGGAGQELLGGREDPLLITGER
jgi:hypothetical protein